MQPPSPARREVRCMREHSMGTEGATWRRTSSESVGARGATTPSGRCASGSTPRASSTCTTSSSPSPAASWARASRRRTGRTSPNSGFQLVYGSTANLFIDRDGNYIGYGPEARELVGIPEPETFCVLPWDRKTARVFCTLFRGTRGGGRRRRVPDLGLPRATSSGSTTSSRRRPACTCASGCEPEMMWLKVNPDGTPSVEGKTKPYCYHIDQFSELQPIIHKVMEYGRAMGLDMIQGDHEDAPGQLELNFMFDRAELTADRLTTYRQICRQVGREMDAFACFMPKPFMGVSANGCHHNISLWEGDENMFLPDGDNPRMPGQDRAARDRRRARAPARAHGDHRADRELVPAVLGRGLLGADLRRLGLPEPDDRPADQRARAGSSTASVDSAVNPYLSFAALLAAMKDGIERKLDPGPPEERNIYEAIAEGKDVKRIPTHLGEALDALEADEVVKAALPGDMYRVFMHYKRDEWNRFLATVSDWDIKEYLDILP